MVALFRPQPHRPPPVSLGSSPQQLCAHCVAAQRLPCWSFKNVQNGSTILYINKKGGLAPVLRPSPGTASSGPFSAASRGPGVFRQHPHSMVPAVLCSWSGRDHQPTRCVPHASQEGLCGQSPRHTARGPEPARSILRLTPLRLGDLAVAARAVLGGALRRPDGLGPLEAVALAAAAPGPTGQRVGAPVHHDGIHAIGH